MYKQILFGDEVRQKIIKGLNITAQAVGSTLGPKGQNVIFEESSYPTITKDGVTVAGQIFLEDKFENMGVMLGREAAENTNREAGDGTTTTVVLLASMVNEANKYIATGMNPVLIKRGMDNALQIVLSKLQKQVKQLKNEDEKLQIATISANNDPEVGKMIFEVIKKVGVDGVVTFHTSNNLKTEVEYVKGTKINSGYASHVFINDRKKLCHTSDNPAIIICSDKITSQDQLVPLIQKMIAAGKRNMVLFADSIEGAGLAFLVQNFMLGKFTCVPVKVSSWGDYNKDLLYDIATLTNTTILGEEDSVKLVDASVEHTGTCEQIVINGDSAIISGGKGNIKNRIDETKTLLKHEKDIYRIERLKSRLGKLTGSIASIKIGGASETEQVEIKYRIEDAINATKSAIQEGIVEGGGVALLKCKFDLPERLTKEELAGYEIVLNVLREPIKKISINAGLNGDLIADKVLDLKKGYNALTDQFENLFEAGVIDPFRVVKNEIINSVATAGILITSGVAIAIASEKK